MEDMEAQRQHADVHPRDKVAIADITLTHPFFRFRFYLPTVQHQKFLDAVCGVRYSEEIFLSIDIVPVGSPDQETFTTVSYHVYCVFIFHVRVEIIFILADCTIISLAWLEGTIG